MLLEDFLQLDGEMLIYSLDGYQQNLLHEMIKYYDGDYNKVADNWLSASPSNTYKFGGEPKNPSIFREKIFEELEMFICGCDEGKYSVEREKLSAQAAVNEKVIISVLSAAIGKSIGVTGAFIAPVIVLILLSIGKIVKNSWCESMKAKREDNN